MSLVKVEIDKHIAVVTLTSPPVNAVSLDMMQELISAFDRISDLDEVRCAVLTGEGKMFSAGADIKSRAGTVPQPGDGWHRSRLARESSYCIVENKKPVIAAINGPALGLAGASLPPVIFSTPLTMPLWACRKSMSA